jgi:cytochrome P450
MLQRPSSTGELAAVFAHFQWMRDAQPVSYDQATASWHVFRYDEVEQVLSNSSYFPTVVAHDAGTPHDCHHIALNASQHYLIQRIMEQGMKAHDVKKLAQHIRSKAQVLLDQLRSQGSMDVIADLAVPLCQSVMAELLGNPLGHWQQLYYWTTALAASTCDEQASRASKEIDRNLSHLFEQHIGQPGPNLISRLMFANVDGTHQCERR